MKRLWSLTTALLLTSALGLWACSDDDTSADSGITKDIGAADMANKDGSKPDVIKPDTVAKDGPKADSSKPDSATKDGPAKDTGKPDTALAMDTGKPDTALAMDTGKPDTIAAKDTGKPDMTITKDTSLPPDAAVGAEMVAYTMGSDTFYQVSLTGGPKAVPGVTTGFSKVVCDINHNGNLTSYPMNMTLNRPQRRNGGNESWIELPNKLGRLVRWKTNKEFGWTLQRLNGSIPMEVKGPRSGLNYSQWVSLSDDGKLLALVMDTKKVKLVRLDNTYWPGTTSFIRDVTPAGSHIWADDESLTMLKNTLYFVTRDAYTPVTATSLWSVPLTGNAKSAKVALPKVGGAAATSIYNRAVINNTRTHAAWLISTSTTKEDVMVVKDGGTPVNASKVAADIIAPNTTYFMDGLNPKIALTPGGGHVVFTTTTGGYTPKIGVMVAKADGTGTALQINSATDFHSVVDTYGAFFFPDNDNLLFAAGVEPKKTGLFRYKLSTKALSWVSNTAPPKKPWLGDGFEFDAGWVSPNGKYLYLLADHGGKTSNIMALDLSTFAKKDITTGLLINSETGADSGFVTLPGSSKVWFLAQKGYVADFYVFDQNTASTPLKLTATIGTATVLGGLDISPDGKQLSYTLGHATTEQIMVMPSGGGTAKAVTSLGVYLGDTYAWTLDSSSIVYATAPAAAYNKEELYLVKATGGTPLKLHAAKDDIHIYSTGK